MRNTLMILALLGLFIAGCESTPRNEEPVVEETNEPKTHEAAEETTEETADETPEEPATEGQTAKYVIYVLGVNGMD